MEAIIRVFSMGMLWSNLCCQMVKTVKGQQKPVRIARKISQMVP